MRLDVVYVPWSTLLTGGSRKRMMTCSLKGCMGFPQARTRRSNRVSSRNGTRHRNDDWEYDDPDVPWDNPN